MSVEPSEGRRANAVRIPGTLATRTIATQGATETLHRWLNMSSVSTHDLLLLTSRHGLRLEDATAFQAANPPANSRGRERAFGSVR
jgi:hypothetical protein